MVSLEDVRARAQKFSDERQWGQFHQPTSLMLAMVGEVGEVAEIFQWRGRNFDVSTMSEADLVLSGEELSDVFIYATRLSQQCNLDLAKCVLEFSRGRGTFPETFDVRPMSSSGEWEREATLPWLLSGLADLNPNPRFFCLRLCQQAGTLSSLFTSSPGNMECELGLENWSPADLASLGHTLAFLVITLTSLAKLLSLDLGECIMRKMDKNERKYPVAQSRGSSAKYTAYQGNNGHLLKTASFACGMLLLGVFLGKRLPAIKF